MRRKRFNVIIVTTSLLVILACSLAESPAIFSQPTQNQTAAIQTQAALLIAGTEAAETALVNAVAATMASRTMETPEFTFTLSQTPSITGALTSPAPMVSVSVATYCRTGPGDPYEILGSLPVGVEAEVIARSEYGDWIIKLPSNPSINCWLWGYHATVTGDTSTLPMATPIPSPTFTATSTTPAASFILEYDSIFNCMETYRIKLRITNDGSDTWESYRAIATDNVTSVSHVIERDDFPELAGLCTIISISDNLEPGEIGYAYSSGISPIPYGHNLTVAVRVCSQDGLAGECLDKTINFTP